MLKRYLKYFHQNFSLGLVVSVVFLDVSAVLKLLGPCNEQY